MLVPSADPQAVRMESLPHKVLTAPTPLLHVDFAECTVGNMGGDSGGGSDGELYPPPNPTHPTLGHERSTPNLAPALPLNPSTLPCS